MAKTIDPALAAILKQFGADPKTDIWDCHGTWVAYHRTLERIAAAAKIVFDAPQIIEAQSDAGVVALCVTGRIGEQSAWSIGEATPKNNKNAYPYAMAEKRAKDRVIIKLVGLHGIYSEDEADDFKPTNGKVREEPAAEPNNADLDNEIIASELIKIIGATKNPKELDAAIRNPDFLRRYRSLPDFHLDRVTAAGTEKRDRFAVPIMAG